MPNEPRPEPRPPLPPDYPERVYAGVLGKIIGVYVGRPVENWSYERIQREIGDIRGYIHEKRGRRLIVTDDDISGTLLFLNALEDFGFPEPLEPWMVGETWLDTLVERQTTLWWGGLGNSTEHTAYLRLKQGTRAPLSGSAATNGRVVSEQIGGQIFIDGWGLVCPGNPERAAGYARVAASVSHDGEAIHGAQVIAAMVAQAFVETDVDRLVETGFRFVPAESEIRRVADALRDWRAAGHDWRQSRRLLEERFGYDRYLGACPIVPNHGLVLLALLYCEGDFAQGMHIVNTSGWDTDCNSGNVGCILGVAGGLSAFDGPTDWRSPVADRLFLPGPDAARCFTDAATEAIRVVNLARRMRGLAPIQPKDGARYHFALPGSTQGFAPTDETTSVTNEDGHLRIEVEGGGGVATWTFIPPSHIDFVSGYKLIGSPTIHGGQKVTATIAAGDTPVIANLFVSRYDEADELVRVRGAERHLGRRETARIEWAVPDTDGFPIAEIGFEVRSAAGGRAALLVDRLDWGGTPSVVLRPRPGRMWGRAWAPCLDRFQAERDGYGHLVHDAGLGMLIQGGRSWRDLRFSAKVTPHLASRAGIAVCVRGMRRFYALLLDHRGRIELVRRGVEESVLASAPMPWDLYREYALVLERRGDRLRAWADGRLLFDLADATYDGGGVALVVDSGAMGVADDVSVTPVGAREPSASEPPTEVARA
ncbi:MAG: ADP-ribosylglycohydrolase family protein [Fimbriimonadaceae bacterium]|nr:ADP-ribosylglycohydrolase family protein [Fimbriimonadaceae bacterium]